jgi:hypothetical protein
VSAADDIDEALSFQAVTVGEFLNRPKPEHGDYLLGPLVERGNRVIVAGETGHGKTTFVLQMVASIVEGREFLGYQGKGDCSALVIDLEQSERSLRARLEAINLSDQERVSLIPLPDGLTTPEHLEELEQQAFSARRYDVVVVDPFYKMHARDSNDERAIDDLTRRLDRWRRQYDFALIIPAHIRKGPPSFGRGPRPLKFDDITGSGVFRNGAEVALAIQFVGLGVSRLYFFKDRDGTLEVAPNTRRKLLFDRAIGGYRLDPNQEDERPKKMTNVDAVRDALLDAPYGLSYQELEEKTPYADKSVRVAVKNLGCTWAVDADGRTKRWMLPVDGRGA